MLDFHAYTVVDRGVHGIGAESRIRRWRLPKVKIGLLEVGFGLLHSPIFSQWFTGLILLARFLAEWCFILSTFTHNLALMDAECASRYAFPVKYLFPPCFL